MGLMRPSPLTADLCAPPHVDYAAEIARMRREMNAVILAHFYQEPAIQDMADFVGDSLQLSQKAAATPADVIVFCGVLFMAETAKILNPGKLVLLPDLEAGCSLADGCKADEFQAFRQRYPDHVSITYINCSAAVKAVSDIICTSSNAERIIRQIPPEQPILFAPDQHLGRFLIRRTGREMLLWTGSCIVHEQFSERKLIELKEWHPQAKVLAHPECREAVLRHADFIGSTNAILNHARESQAAEFIVATETGILYQMQKACPDKKFIPAPNDGGCQWGEGGACSECPYMRLNSMEKLYLAMRDRKPEITLDEELRRRALRPIQRMLEMS